MWPYLVLGCAQDDLEHILDPTYAEILKIQDFTNF